MNIIFFGSTDDSVIVLERIHQLSTVNLSIVAIITQPPRPIGRKQVLTSTPVEIWAKEKKIPVLVFPTDPVKPWLFAHENAVIKALAKCNADLFISASFGQKIPREAIKQAKYGGLNVHPSLLPRWRGADPVPWAILAGDKEIGISVVTLSEKFDQGVILAQQKIPLDPRDTSDPLRTKLFSLGASLLIKVLPKHLTDNCKHYQPSSTMQQYNNLTISSYARRFTREDGFIPWELIKASLEGKLFLKSTIQQYSNITIVKAQEEFGRALTEKEPLGVVVERAFRALSPWPGVWTFINPTNPTNTTNPTNQKRLKIHKLHLDKGKLILDEVQLEGKKPVSYQQFSRAYQPRETARSIRSGSTASNRPG